MHHGMPVGQQHAREALGDAACSSARKIGFTQNSNPHGLFRFPRTCHRQLSSGGRSVNSARRILEQIYKQQSRSFIINPGEALF